MIDPVNSSLYPYEIQPYSESSPETQDEQVNLLPDESLSTPKDTDTIRISAKALNMYNKSTEEESVSANSWEMVSGLKSGTTILENGHKQSVKINGSSMELLEYDGDTLVRSVTGELTATGAVLETTIFDSAGEKVQTINTVFDKIEDTNAGWTSARVDRDIQWFKDGDVSRTMTDSMQLRSKYTGGENDSSFPSLMDSTQAQSIDLSKLGENITNDSHETKYYASIQEYSNNQISKKIIIKKNDDFLNKSNRGFSKTDELDAGATQEIAHSKSLSIEMQNYDSNGDLILSANFLDSRSDGPGSEDGIEKQQMSLSMYKKGELVKESHSSTTLKESKDKKLAKTGDLLQTLDLTKEEYVTRKPSTAAELLAIPLMETSSKANFYTAATQKDISGHALDSAKDISKSGEDNRVHDISWGSETYKDGDLVTKQEHKESAVKNPQFAGLSFRTGGALTENDNHQLIHRSSHALETYDKGMLKDQISVESREKIDKVENGPDKVYTLTTITEGIGFNTKRTKNIADGELADNDPLAHAASSEMGQDTSLILEDNRKLFSSLDAENSGPKNNKYKVSFISA
ncbi:hypothetical protein [Desulfovibrio sp. UCD-KL4C]|uniref:hypothetical protein n=1 Tax=Desulfovibrio sp. UCD-KL4C TaxID=2578120 RepID=UPI0025B85E92|nr:hypothetical protein [Desulfovibrio sp. UCD-KL4C]